MIQHDVRRCASALAAKGYSIAFAESATAGRLSYEFSLTPDSGAILLGGLVCYDAALKEELLDIDPALIERYTAESAEVTKAMAQGLQHRLKADVSVALTGLTTPGGSETDEKPVGTIFAHLILPGKQVARRLQFEGPAEAILDQTVAAVAAVLMETL